MRGKTAAIPSGCGDVDAKLINPLSVARIRKEWKRLSGSGRGEERHGRFTRRKLEKIKVLLAGAERRDWRMLGGA